MGRSSEGISRRRLLKEAALGALAFAAAPAFVKSRTAAAFEPGAALHPNVNPLRVVGARDPLMISGQQVPPAIQAQNALVAGPVVSEDLDRMAMALAQETDEARAWRAILLKPATKGWADTVVAVKTNHIAEQRVRSAVVSKVCHVLTDVCGVQGANIHIYDACHGWGMAGERIYGDLPEGVHVADQWGGYNTQVPVPAPYKGGSATAPCLGHLARGEVDILVNLALCKGHGAEFGGFTMALKNHFGTFDPGLSHQPGGGTDYLIGINRTPQVLGPLGEGGGVLFPRQQLVVVDALWGSEPGPGGPPTHQMNTLLMGVFGPAVDYVGATQVRQDIMGWRINRSVAERFLTDFGFSTADLPNGGRVIDALQVA